MTYDATIWRANSVWCWACSCGKRGSSTAQIGVELAAYQHEHKRKDPPP